jgi:hypothetical protein
MEIYNLIRIDQVITNAHAIRLFIFNQRLPQLAKESLRKSIKTNLRVADVESPPYKTKGFDTLVNTMAFTGYADGNLAFSEK